MIDEIFEEVDKKIKRGELAVFILKEFYTVFVEKYCKRDHAKGIHCYGGDLLKKLVEHYGSKKFLKKEENYPDFFNEHTFNKDREIVRRFFIHTLGDIKEYYREECHDCIREFLSENQDMEED